MSCKRWVKDQFLQITWPGTMHAMAISSAEIYVSTFLAEEFVELSFTSGLISVKINLDKLSITYAPLIYNFDRFCKAMNGKMISNYSSVSLEIKGFSISILGLSNPVEQFNSQIKAMAEK